MKIGIIGSGAWGTALALISQRAGHQVKIWSRQQEICEQINQTHKNPHYLPDIHIPENITSSCVISDMLDNEILLLSIPAQSIRQIVQILANANLSPKTILIICAKGIEQVTLKLMSEVVSELLPNNSIAVLSGPNFAHEIAQNLPAITSIASSSKTLSEELSQVFNSSNFRIYPNHDIIGIQIIGAAKNVLAIAAGITIGKNFGENAKAAVISRGIYEISELISAKGGEIQTLLTPAGIGDINLTCSSEKSRNTTFGIALAKGKSAQTNILVEGYYTSESISLLAKSLNIEMPICEAIYKIAYQKFSVSEAIRELLDRPIKLP